MLWSFPSLPLEISIMCMIAFMDYLTKEVSAVGIYLGESFLLLHGWNPRLSYVLDIDLPCPMSGFCCLTSWWCGEGTEGSCRSGYMTGDQRSWNRRLESECFICPSCKARPFNGPFCTRKSWRQETYWLLIKFDNIQQRSKLATQEIIKEIKL